MGFLIEAILDFIFEYFYYERLDKEGRKKATKYFRIGCLFLLLIIVGLLFVSEGNLIGKKP